MFSRLGSRDEFAEEVTVKGAKEQTGSARPGECVCVDSRYKKLVGGGSAGTGGQGGWRSKLKRAWDQGRASCLGPQRGVGLGGALVRALLLC